LSFIKTENLIRASKNGFVSDKIDGLDRPSFAVVGAGEDNYRMVWLQLNAPTIANDNPAAVTGTNNPIR
jgi:hypothetical protein